MLFPPRKNFTVGRFTPINGEFSSAMRAILEAPERGGTTKWNTVRSAGEHAGRERGSSSGEEDGVDAGIMASVHCTRCRTMAK